MALDHKLNWEDQQLSHNLSRDTTSQRECYSAINYFLLYKQKQMRAVHIKQKKNNNTVLMLVLWFSFCSKFKHTCTEFLLCIFLDV